MESEHGTKLGELEPAKWFHEYIGWVLITRDMRNGNLLALDLIANPVVGAMHMFHCRLVLRVFGDLDGGLVVNKEWGWA